MTNSSNLPPLPKAPGAPAAGIAPVGGKPAAPPPLPNAKVAAAPNPVDGQVQPPNDLAVPLNFWQQPWVQNVLPFVTSVTFHATLILLGLVVYGTYQYVKTIVPHTDEVVIPDASMIDAGPPGGVPFQGLNNDPMHQAHQDKEKENTSPEGWADRKGLSREVQAPGGGEGDSSDTTIAVGPGGGFGKGAGHGGGQGNGLATGEGDGGPLAMFGTPGGGGIGPKGPVFGNGGNARKIAFVCDASGSMLNKFSVLRRELSRTVQALRPIQSFDIIFFQEEKAAALDQNSLLMATPEHKLQAQTFLEEKVTPRGTTNPLPGLEIAFKQHPQLVYILTDGDFPDNDAVLRKINELNKDRKVRINTIAFVGEGDNDKAFQDLLKRIAKENGGVYKYVREGDL